VDAVERFAALVAGSGAGLDEAALAIGAGAAADLDPARWLGELDRLAEGVGSLDGLIRRLFVEEGFAGNTERYYDPRNSLLHEVLARRLGIPITLSVVCLEVGRRAGVALEAVGMPGHFLVRPVGTQRYLDAFAGGQLLDLAGCEARFRTSTGAGPDIPFGPDLLSTTPTWAILARILENLRAVYRNAGRASDLEWVLRMRLVLPGVGAAELVELGQAMAQQGRWLDAVRFLESQADTWPQHADLLHRSAHSLRARLN
jgi:regulator of sirC expression with transglutaminase-like and TPR domain